jgi:flavin reductase (DIM6/NTAB) family NADH-FMN oxidoreductase RutF
MMQSRADMAGNVASFTPDDDALAFRVALGNFATGVTVITITTPEGPMGITANSFASVSLDPPLVLWSPARASHRFEHFARAPRFAIHVLAADQRHVGDGFIKSKTAFGGLDWSPSQANVPLIAGALAVFECNFEAAHHAGDHDIVIGRVIRAHHRPGRPLIFHGGRYGEFADRA